ncbi:hypothetical protein D3C77_432900 [compost metagenome]
MYARINHCSRHIGSVEQLKALDRIKAKPDKGLVQEALSTVHLKRDAFLRAAAPQYLYRCFGYHRVSGNRI